MAPAVTRVKICGITRLEDAVAAEAAGAHAIGLVFFQDSPRNLNIDRARAIAMAVGPFISRVALFVNPDRALVEAVVEAVQPDLLQFHGDEEANFCRIFGRRYIKAVRMREDTDVEAAMAAHPEASGFLFDSWQADKYGGTGKSFDWRRMPRSDRKHLILAGGLNAENVATAIQSAKPYAVDVSGGVETAPGIKDHDLIAEFIRTVNNS